MAPNPFHFIWRGCCIVGEQICRSIRRPLVRGSVLPGLTGAARGLHEIHRRWVPLSSPDVLRRRLRRRRPQTSLASFQGLRQPRLQDGRLQGLPQLVLAERQWQILPLRYQPFLFFLGNFIWTLVGFANSVSYMLQLYVGLSVAYLSGRKSSSGQQFGNYTEDDVDALRAIAEEPGVVDLLLTYPSIPVHYSRRENS